MIEIKMVLKEEGNIGDVCLAIRVVSTEKESTEKERLALIALRNAITENFEAQIPGKGN